MPTREQDVRYVLSTLVKPSAKKEKEKEKKEKRAYRSFGLSVFVSQEASREYGNTVVNFLRKGRKHCCDFFFVSFVDYHSTLSAGIVAN